MNCEECSNSPATRFCSECEEALCEECDHVLHRGGRRKSHARKPICVCGHAGDNVCCNCSVATCDKCQYQHANHILEAVSTSSPTAVFWDVSACKPADVADIAATVAAIKSCFKGVASIQAYGEACRCWTDDFAAAGVQFEAREGLKETHALLLDMSVQKGFANLVVLSANAAQIKPHLLQLQSSLPKVTISVCLNAALLSPIEVAQLPNPIFLQKQATRSSVDDIEACPVLQVWPKKPGQDAKHDSFLTMLADLAVGGQLMHEAGWLTRHFSQKHRCSTEQSTSIIRGCEALGLLHKSERKFGNLKTVVFISLKLESISLEALLWVLRSLKNDEMLPTERAIQSRMKEVFDFKPSPLQWMGILERCKSFKWSAHMHSSSAPAGLGDWPTYLGNPLESPLEHVGLVPSRIPHFSIQTHSDVTTASECNVIYPVSEEWDSIDQYIRDSDVLSIKGTEDWHAFTSYLEHYFLGPNRRVDENKAIAGGRYGCAQFLKFCGPPTLRRCSLGKLSYMIQLAINEDLFRYQRTLLVWRPAGTKKRADQATNQKLSVVKRQVIEILRENRNGLSLAQLPLHLKKRISFTLDLPELGFAKLKDLLLTMTEVDLELRGTNQPFAVLRKYKSFQARTVGEIKKALSDILAEYRLGLSGVRAENLLMAQLGQTLNWRDYSCANLYEFVQRNASSDFDVVLTGDSKMLIKSEVRRTQSLSEKSSFGSLDFSTGRSETSSTASDLYATPMFYGSQFQPRIVNVSNLPADVVPRQESGVIDFEMDRKQMFINRVLGSEGISTKLQGACPQHYRTDSVEYHSNSASSQPHSKGHSADFSSQKLL